jgi:N-formylglutamate deformylase
MTALPPSEVYTLHAGTAPLVVSCPHVGTFLPDDLRRRLVDRAAAVEDTDWYIDRLYGFVTGLGASLLVPRASRYVIDLNRPRENAPMYAGQNNTELVPTHFFTGDPLYHRGQAPGAAEVAERVHRWWQPYHDALAAEVARLRALHGHVVLFDAHSIRSELPWLFPGTLPHLNLGTAGGTSCAPALQQRLERVLAAQDRYEVAVNGRFKGGHITRAYGDPARGVHAVQLEMAWRTYMDDALPPRWNAATAAEVTPLLHELMQTMIDWRPEPANPAEPVRHG